MRREIIEYNKNLKERARELRNNSTPMEIRLWKYLKGKQMEGFDFHRQKPLNNFIVDFYCCELKLAIEIDGSSHIGKEEYDKVRQQILEKYGISFLRFTNNDVSKNIEGVIETIRIWIKNNKPIINASQKINAITKKHQFPKAPLLRGVGGVGKHTQRTT